MKGVRRVVRMPDAVAVVADSWWRAKRALDALPIVWDDRGNGGVCRAPASPTLVRSGIRCGQCSQIGRRRRRAAASRAAVRRIEAEYTVPFLAHATMEPQNLHRPCQTRRRLEVLGADPGCARPRSVTAAVAAGVPNDKIVVTP
jgi:isoquinoline 1-oxidoreductase beta subunit